MRQPAANGAAGHGNRIMQQIVNMKEPFPGHAAGPEAPPYQPR